MAQTNTDRLSQSILDFIRSRRWKHWLLVLIVLLLVVYVAYTVRAIWVPIGIAFLIALVLDPVVDRMEGRGWGRPAATVFIFAGFLVGIFALIWVSVPAVSEEAAHLGQQIDNRLPDRSPAGITSMLEKEGVAAPLRKGIVAVVTGFERSIGRSIDWFSTNAAETIESLITIIIIPIITFYALRDFHLILAKGLLLVPKPNRDLVKTLVTEISGVFGKYMRGLMLVSFMNGVATWLLLEALGTPSALILGILAGVLYPVPYIGALTTVVLVVGVEFVTRGMQMMLPVLAANILLHQVIFDYIVAPRVLGGHVGLHPIWSIVALLSGNALMGFVGMIIAVPVAASIQIAVVALVPKLGIALDLPEHPENGDSAHQLEQETKAEHVKVDAVEVLHESVSEAVEKIEREAEDAERYTG